MGVPMVTPVGVEREYFTKFHTHVKPRLTEVLTWLKQGFTEYSISDKLGICQDTWAEYKKHYPELSELYARATSERNNLVMNSMFSKATGDIVNVKQEKMTKDGVVIVLNSEIYTPPDVNAADLYLRNRMPGYIQPKQDSGGSVTITVQLPSVQAELDRIGSARLALEAELATIDLLPDAGGAYARPGPESAELPTDSDNSEDPDPFSHNCTA